MHYPRKVIISFKRVYKSIHFFCISHTYSFEFRTASFSNFGISNIVAEMLPGNIAPGKSPPENNLQQKIPSEKNLCQKIES